MRGYNIDGWFGVRDFVAKTALSQLELLCVCQVAIAKTRDSDMRLLVARKECRDG